MLEQKLNELEQSDIYPFHMPGHKRAFLPFANPYAIDITEIEGFDNLHPRMFFRHLYSKTSSSNF